MTTETIEPYNEDYYVRITEYGDNIEAYAKANGGTLDQALEAGVYSNDTGAACVYVPDEVFSEWGN